MPSLNNNSTDILLPVHSSPLDSQQLRSGSHPDPLNLLFSSFHPRSIFLPLTSETANRRPFRTKSGCRCSCIASGCARLDNGVLLSRDCGLRRTWRVINMIATNRKIETDKRFPSESFYFHRELSSGNFAKYVIGIRLPSLLTVGINNF